MATNQAAAVVSMAGKRWNQNIRPNTEGHYVIGTLRNNAEFANWLLAVRDAQGISMLVEVGTYHGESTTWAAEHFASVITIDSSAENLFIATKRCEGYSNISFIYGSISSDMGDVVGRLSTTSIVFLDIDTARGGAVQAEIIDALRCIIASPYRHFIFLNDARCFGVQDETGNHVSPEICAIAEHAGYSIEERCNAIALLPR